MKLRMHVQTPKGQGQGSEKKLRTFLLGMHRPTETGYKNDGFYWEIDCDVTAYMRLQKKAYMFSQLASGVVSNKVFKGAAQKMGATKQQLKEVEDMLLNGTRIDIIKNATAEELDKHGTTWWDRFKRQFTRTE